MGNGQRLTHARHCLFLKATRYPQQDTAKTSSQAVGASRKTYLTKGKTATEREEGGGKNRERNRR